MSEGGEERPVEDSRPSTYEHVADVQALLLGISAELARRAMVHDASKLQSTERAAWDVMRPAVDAAEHDSPEYHALLAEMQPTLDHHFARNSHHPEHHAAGILGMDMLDLIEMVCDWIAASRRDGKALVPYIRGGASRRFEIPEALAELMVRSVSPILDVELRRSIPEYGSSRAWSPFRGALGSDGMPVADAREPLAARERDGYTETDYALRSTEAGEASGGPWKAPEREEGWVSAGPPTSEAVPVEVERYAQRGSSAEEVERDRSFGDHPGLAPDEAQSLQAPAEYMSAERLAEIAREEARPRTPLPWPPREEVEAAAEARGLGERPAWAEEPKRAGSASEAAGFDELARKIAAGEACEVCLSEDPNLHYAVRDGIRMFSEDEENGGRCPNAKFHGPQPSSLTGHVIVSDV